MAGMPREMSFATAASVRSADARVPSPKSRASAGSMDNLPDEVVDCVVSLLRDDAAFVALVSAAFYRSEVRVRGAGTCRVAPIGSAFTSVPRLRHAMEDARLRPLLFNGSGVDSGWSELSVRAAFAHGDACVLSRVHPRWLAYPAASMHSIAQAGRADLLSAELRGDGSLSRYFATIVATLSRAVPALGSASGSAGIGSSVCRKWKTRRFCDLVLIPAYASGTLSVLRLFERAVENAVHDSHSALSAPHASSVVATGAWRACYARERRTALVRAAASCSDGGAALSHLAVHLARSDALSHKRARRHVAVALLHQMEHAVSGDALRWASRQAESMDALFKSVVSDWGGGVRALDTPTTPPILWPVRADAYRFLRSEAATGGWFGSWPGDDARSFLSPVPHVPSAVICTAWQLEQQSADGSAKCERLVCECLRECVLDMSRGAGPDARFCVHTLLHVLRASPRHAFEAYRAICAHRIDAGRQRERVYKFVECYELVFQLLINAVREKYVGVVRALLWPPADGLATGKALRSMSSSTCVLVLHIALACNDACVVAAVAEAFKHRMDRSAVCVSIDEAVRAGCNAAAAAALGALFPGFDSGPGPIRRRRVLPLSMRVGAILRTLSERGSELGGERRDVETGGCA